ncbi:hypothetical protein [uncultured Clostridium sp.]|uniref:hypothetical protein n=1 Tax=uncultured Clostridium sp. TaxID=59620 RepID=UPI0028EFC45F|nr:hypothetical protein [uncultured Clostridium sp.]
MYQEVILEVIQIAIPIVIQVDPIVIQEVIQVGPIVTQDHGVTKADQMNLLADHLVNLLADNI